MGGGLVLGNTLRVPSRTCQDARAQHLPNANAICASGGGYAHSSSSGFASGTTSARTSSIASVARGGFGVAGHAASGS
jgi:hypothetical protein